MKIILIRHGESEGNIDKSIYSRKPDYLLELTENGVNQSTSIGKILSFDLYDYKPIIFYVSP